MSNFYPDLKDYGLSSDEEGFGYNRESFRESFNDHSSKRNRATPMSKPSLPYSKKHSSSRKMTPLSNFDYKPRNIEFDGSKFVPSQRSGNKEKYHQDGNSFGSVPLLVFDHHGNHDGGVRRVEGHKMEPVNLGEAWKGFLQWLGQTEKWKVITIGCVVGLIFAMTLQSYRTYIDDGLYLGISPTDNLLKCSIPSGIYDQPCLTSSQLRSALILGKTLRPYLHKRAGNYECGVELVESMDISIEELQKTLSEDPGKGMLHFIYLALHNPHWNIVLMNGKGEEVTKWFDVDLSAGRLQSISPYLSYGCTIRKFILKIWSRVKFLVLVVMVIFILLGVASWYLRRRQMAERDKYIMIEKILSVLRRHYEATKRKKDLLPYLAIIHVRDMLISPSERDRKLKLWEEACKWIAKYESRVRIERQRIAGEDFDVWKWIYIDPPATEEPLTFNEQGLTSSNVASARKKNWYSGTTFDDETGKSTGRNSRINSPYGFPSPCIRLKNMFEAIKHMNDEQSKEIEDSVLDRCMPHGGVVHTYVDRRSTLGCVYFKMDSVESAVGAYKALHGGWYKGKLVTAKYIPVEKYHKWFPAAANAKEHIQPAT